MNNLKLVLGGPGCGKTTRLLEIVKAEMAAGVPPSAIAFVTFTKAAATEAKERAAKEFSLNPEQDLPWFRTIHSLAYARLNVQRDEIMDRRDWAEFSDVVGEVLTGAYVAEEGVPTGGREVGDTMLRIIDYASTTCMGLAEAWHTMDEVVDWYRLKSFYDALRAYKHDTGKMDFTDLLHGYVREGLPVDVQVAVIDEAQDLTAAQWEVVRHAFCSAERVYIGGDDDQAIYHWAGADVPQFLGLSARPETLTHSHRLPVAVHALSQQIARRISTRYVKQFTPDARPGIVGWHQYPMGIDLQWPGTWFLLARNTYMLRGLEAMVREQGLNYTRRHGAAVNPGHVRAMQLWERLRNAKQMDMSAQEYKALMKALDQPKPQVKELQRYRLLDTNMPSDTFNKPWFEALVGIPDDHRDYYLACLRRGESLTRPPRIRIETIHGVKGAEADHVLLMTDMSGRTARSFRLNEDNEHRVYYVGATRARESLHIVLPQSDQAYPIT